MLDAQDLENIDEKGIAFTIRSVFIIDPAKKIWLTMMYPASCGRNTLEVLRVIDSLQTADKKGITTPINWQVGDDGKFPYCCYLDELETGIFSGKKTSVLSRNLILGS
jgi:alkyl hydroperoxide reductase subunit AhpC